MKDIAPGSRINIKVVKQPTSVAAGKTLARLLSKDPAAVAEAKRQRDIRVTNYNPKRRGGRLYSGRVVRQAPAEGKVGETGCITATCDVLRDLGRVQRFLEITKA
ncbi:MAG: hypothetical protein IT445_19415 [Phycisphaeraceae bacterium]|nr:hypothetical protein [Phycisphaeraceae bacterium]